MPLTAIQSAAGTILHSIQSVNALPQLLSRAGCCRPGSTINISSSDASSRNRTQRSSSQCRMSAYDNPAIYSNDDAFSERLYWDKRYERDPTTFEWYRSYDSLKPILTQHLPKQQPILQLGVGTSRIQEDMADDCYSHITSIDYSPVAVQRLQQTYPARPQLQYAVADARSMPQYGDTSFAGVLDKGTLDALLCGDDDERAAAELLSEVWRLLAPGGTYVMITSAGPKGRLQYLQTPATPWQQLMVYEVGQQGAMNGPYLCSSSSSSSSSGSTYSRPAAIDGGGSSSCSDAETETSGIRGGVVPAAAGAVPGQQSLQLQEAMQLPLMGYSHMVYVCYKP